MRRGPTCIIVSVNDVTRILNRIQQGDRKAASQLLPLVYDELRQVARQRLVGEAPGQTLDATALVHEVYVRLVGAAEVQPQFADQKHFFAVAAEAMRHILVDRARRKRRAKHGGRRKRVPLDDAVPAPPSAAEDLLALDEALTRLGIEDPEAASVVQLRYFAGLSVEDAATTLGISRATAYRHWTFARAWLLQQLSGEPG